jgi:hypothetical protein
MVNCYTLDDDLTDGINVRDFDSIIAAEATEQIYTARIHVVETDIVPVCFVVQAVEDEKLDTGAAVLAVNTAKWKLLGAGGIDLLDPAGTGNFVLLLIREYHCGLLYGRSHEYARTLFFRKGKLPGLEASSVAHNLLAAVSPAAVLSVCDKSRSSIGSKKRSASKRHK